MSIPHTRIRGVERAPAGLVVGAFHGLVLLLLLAAMRVAVFSATLVFAWPPLPPLLPGNLLRRRCFVSGTL